LLQQGTVPDAVAALESAVRLDPSSGEAHYQLGLALARAGRKDEAAVALQKGRDLVASSDRDQRAGLDLAEGRAALDRGQPDQAVASLQRAVRARPDSVEAQRDLDRARAAVGARVEVRVRDVPASVSPSVATPAAAAVASTATAAAAPADDPVIVAAVEAHIRDSRFAEAEPIAAEYTRTRPTSPWGWYALGYSQFAQQKIGDAIKSLAKSLELDVRNPEAHKILGRTMMLIGRFDAARVEFEQGLRATPDSAELHYNLGKLSSIQDDWPAAKTSLEAAVRIDAGYLEALEALGFAREALGDDAGAVAAYTKAVALNDERKGTFAAAHVSLSAYYNRTDRPDQALVFAKRALELDPKSDRGWFQKARADERQGRLEEAVIALNQAIAYNSRASSYYYVLAGVCRRLGWTDDSQEALKTFKRLEQESRELDEQRRKGGAPVPSTRPGSQP
ncbi:MAG: tetratricopeptide repeat protein, partial [Vicinamibacteraceae bacterium]